MYNTIFEKIFRLIVSNPFIYFRDTINRHISNPSITLMACAQETPLYFFIFGNIHFQADIPNVRGDDNK